MKRTIFAVLLTIAAAPAWAEWVSVSEGARAVFYIDPATILRNGNLRKVWKLIDLKVRDPKGFLSLRAFMEYDCNERRSRILSESQHLGQMATGDTLSVITPKLEWDYEAPGTSGVAILKTVCSR